MAAAAAALVTIDEFLGSLAARFPDDADDLKAAQEVLQQQRLTSCDRLSKLTDGQWQRLNLPIGIEALLLDEVNALTTVAADAIPRQHTSASSANAGNVPWPSSSGSRRTLPTGNGNGELPLEEFEPSSGLHQRRAAHGHERPQRPTEQRTSSQLPVELTPPPDLEEQWQELLCDTLPPDKRTTLQEAWQATGSIHDRYMMLLEYTSYLRKKPEASTEEQAEQRKRLEPLMRDLGINLGGDEMEQPGLYGTALWWLCAGLVVFAMAAAYASWSRPDPAQDMQEL